MFLCLFVFFFFFCKDFCLLKELDLFFCCFFFFFFFAMVIIGEFSYKCLDFEEKFLGHQQLKLIPNIL